MKRYIVLLCGLLCGVVFVRAQFDPQIGQYMFMRSVYNPAAVGEGDLMRVYGSHRMQFTGIMDAPMTTNFSFSSPFVIGKTSHAAGVRFMNDRFGLFFKSEFLCRVCLSYKVGQGLLECGGRFGFYQPEFCGG